MKKLLLIALVLSAVSCSNYRRGSLLHPQIKTIAIVSVDSDGVDPGVERILKAKVREALVKEGSLTLTSAKSADIILRLKINSYQQGGLATIKQEERGDDDEETYRSTLYRLRFGVNYKVVTRENWDFVEGDTTTDAIFAEYLDLVVEKNEALNQAAKRAAGNIVNSITEGR